MLTAVSCGSGDVPNIDVHMLFRINEFLDRMGVGGENEKEGGGGEIGKEEGECGKEREGRKTQFFVFVVFERSLFKLTWVISRHTT